MITEFRMEIGEGFILRSASNLSQVMVDRSGVNLWVPGPDIGVQLPPKRRILVEGPVYLQNVSGYEINGKLYTGDDVEPGA